MVMEGRDQQSVVLNRDTHAMHRNGNREHMWNKSGQLDMFPNRWLRISFAARKKAARFDNMLCHITADTLREAFETLEPSKALGIDGVSKSAYARDLEANLRDLQNRIHAGSYQPQPKREVLIPKANGKKRPIAISCLEDKIVEAVVAKVLEAAYEPIFIQNSFGFRPNKSAHDAIKEIYQTLKDQKRPHVVEIDFANCFGSIPHRKLIKVLTQRISDRRFKGLIGRFLKVGILDQAGKTVFPTQGIPQGSIMSPVLANIFLHDVLDKWFIENYASRSGVIVRYADDAVFFFKSEEEAQQFILQLDQRVRSFGLELNKDKTRIIKFDKDEENELEFLGLSLYYGKDSRGRRLINLKTMQKTLHRKIQEFYQWIKTVRSKFKLGYIWKQAKAKLSGHYNYFGYDTNVSKLNQFYFEAIRSLFKWLNRRSQLRSFSWKKFQRKLKQDPMPLPPVKAYLRQLRRNVFHIQANRWLRSPVREIRMRGSVGVLPPSLAFCNSMEER